jgi:hypothetical protein
MAIKGKTRSKAKAKTHHPGRAPRRDPVPVPAPLFRRRWVQLVAVFVLGLGAFALGVWVTNGLRRDTDEKAAAASAATRATALQKWQTEVEQQLATVAQMPNGSNTLQPPPVSPEVTDAVSALAKGEKPSSSPTDLKDTADKVGAAAEALDKFDLAGALRDQGFGGEIEGIFASRTEFVAALRGYQNAASLSVLAMTTGGKRRASVAADAKSALDSANTLLQEAWSNYVFALEANNLVTIAPSTGSALGGGLGGGGLGVPAGAPG